MTEIVNHYRASGGRPCGSGVDKEPDDTPKSSISQPHIVQKDEVYVWRKICSLAELQISVKLLLRVWERRVWISEFQIETKVLWTFVKNPRRNLRFSQSPQYSRVSANV